MESPFIFCSCDNKHYLHFRRLFREMDSFLTTSQKNIKFLFTINNYMRYCQILGKYGRAFLFSFKHLFQKIITTFINGATEFFSYHFEKICFINFFLYIKNGTCFNNLVESILMNVISDPDNFFKFIFQKWCA